MSWADVEGTPSDKEKVEFTKFPEGLTVIRALDKDPYSYWNHWLPKQGMGTSCLGAKECPICHVIAESKANKVTAPYSSTKRHAIRIWNYTTNRMEIMAQGKNFFSDLQTLHKDVGDITTYDIKVKRTGTEMNDTKYMLLPAAPSEFAFAGNESIVDVDWAVTLKPIDKDKLLLLMEGKSIEEVFKKSDDEE